MSAFASKTKSFVGGVVALAIIGISAPFVTSAPAAKAISDTWCTHEGNSQVDTIRCYGNKPKAYKYRERVKCSPVVAIYGSTYQYSPWAKNGNPATVRCPTLWYISAKLIQWKHK